MRALLTGLAATLFMTFPALATDRAALSAQIEKLATDYLAMRAGAEHFSGISISLSLPGKADSLNLTIGTPTADDPAGFGLGVMGFASPVLGQGWQYEGGTIGFRMVYVWLPEPDLVVAVGLDSNVNEDNDHIGKLASAILKAAMAQR